MVFISQAGSDYCEQARKKETSGFLQETCREEGEQHRSELCTKEPKQKQKGEVIKWKCGSGEERTDTREGKVVVSGAGEELESS